MSGYLCAKLFRIGPDQVICILIEFELPGDNAIMRRDRNRLILDPAPPRSLLARLAELPTLDEDFGPIGDSTPAPIQL